VPRDGSSAGIWYRNDENVSAILTGVAPSAVNDAPPSVDLATNRVVSLRDDQDPSQAVGSLRRGGAKIPEIRKHPPETGPKTGLKTASTLSAVEPVSAPPKRKLENRHQRPEPETRPARAEMPEIADQRLGHPSLTCGNVGDSPPPGNNTPETGLAG
jgi:hypothetical protein